MNAIPLTEGAFFVSNSFLEWIQTCSRGAKLQKLDARVSSTKAAGMNFGSILHSGLEMHYKQQEFTQDPQEIAAKVAWVFQQEFEKEPNPEDDFRNLNWAMEIYSRFIQKPVDFQLLRYDEAKPCDHCLGLGYLEKILDDDDDSGPQDWEKQPCQWCNGTGKCSIMCEVPFVCKLCDMIVGPDGLNPALPGSILPIFYHGYIDLPILWHNKILVRDFKTTSILGNGFWDDKKASMQQKGYAWAFQELTKQAVLAYSIQAIRVLPPPKNVLEGKTKRDGSPAQSIQDWWNDSIVEQTFFLGEGELDEWKNDAIDLVERFFWEYARGKFPKETMWCSGKFGRCQYYEVCHTYPVSDREQILGSGLFKDKEQRMPYEN